MKQIVNIIFCMSILQVFAADKSTDPNMQSVPTKTIKTEEGVIQQPGVCQKDRIAVNSEETRKTLRERPYQRRRGSIDPLDDYEIDN